MRGWKGLTFGTDAPWQAPWSFHWRISLLAPSSSSSRHPSLVLLSADRPPSLSLFYSSALTLLLHMCQCAAGGLDRSSSDSDKDVVSHPALWRGKLLLWISHMDIHSHDCLIRSALSPLVPLCVCCVFIPVKYCLHHPSEARGVEWRLGEGWSQFIFGHRLLIMSVNNSTSVLRQQLGDFICPPSLSLGSKHDGFFYIWHSPLLIIVPGRRC